MEVTTVAPSAPADTAAPAAAPPSVPAAPAPETPSPADKQAAAAAALDKDLGKVWDKAQKETDEPAPSEAKSAPERGPDGKFKGKLPDPNLPAPDAKPPAPVATKDQPNPEAPPAAPAAEAPKWWSGELQERFKTLPPEVQKALGEQALTDRQNISKLGNALQSYEPLRKVISDYRSDFEASGVDPVTGINQLLRAQQMLANPSTRAEAYKYLLQNFPHDLQHGDGLGLPPDPEMQGMRDQIAQLQGRLNGYEQRERQQQEQTQQHQYRASLTDVEWAEQSLPDFQALAPDIAVLIPAIRNDHPNLSHRDLLTAAHEVAAWKNPATRAKRTAAEVKKQMEAADSHAKEARRAAGVNVASKPRPATPGDMDSLLGGVWDKRHNAA